MTRNEAELAGLCKYERAPCNRCDNTVFYVSNNRCVACMRKQRRGKRASTYVRKRKQTYLFKLCAHCEVKFRTFPSRVVRGEGKYCSRACTVAARGNRSKAA